MFPWDEEQSSMYGEMPRSPVANAGMPIGNAQGAPAPYDPRGAMDEAMANMQQSYNARREEMQNRPPPEQDVGSMVSSILLPALATVATGGFGLPAALAFGVGSAANQYSKTKEAQKMAPLARASNMYAGDAEYAKSLSGLPAFDDADTRAADIHSVMQTPKGFFAVRKNGQVVPMNDPANNEILRLAQSWTPNFDAATNTTTWTNSKTGQASFRPGPVMGTAGPNSAPGMRPPQQRPPMRMPGRPPQAPPQQPPQQPPQRPPMQPPQPMPGAMQPPQPRFSPRQNTIDYAGQQEAAKQDAANAAAAKQQLPEQQVIKQQAERQLANMRSMLANIEGGKYGMTGPIIGNVRSMWDEDVAALRAEGVKTTLENMKIANLAPVSNFELGFVERMGPSAGQTQAQNKAATKMLIRILEGKLRGMQFSEAQLRQMANSHGLSVPEDVRAAPPAGGAGGGGGAPRLSDDDLLNKY